MNVFVPAASFTTILLVSMLGGCESTPPVEPEESSLPIPAISAQDSIREATARVQEAVRDPRLAELLLKQLADTKRELDDGNRPAARVNILEFVWRLEELVGKGELSPFLGDELLLYAGDSLSAIGFAPRCAVTPGSTPPAFLYSSSIVCVSRLPANPADPDVPLPPDSKEHCNPVARTLLLELREKALKDCAADAYGCVPVDCPTCCDKDAKPGFTVPRVTFTPNSANCADEPVNKHSCAAIGFYYCGCSCKGVEDT